MRQLLLLPVALASFGVLALAGDIDSPPAAEKAQRFHRNRDLVQTLVDSGLRLASEESPLRRADHCNDLAQRLADEIRQAATAREGYRALELGDHLKDLLHDGVASLLRNSRDLIDDSSPGQKELKRIQNNVGKVTQPVEEYLKGMDDEENREQLEQAWRAVQKGREEVDNVLNSLGKKPAISGPAPPPGTGPKRE